MRPRWSLVPLLALAGFLSAVFTMWFMWPILVGQSQTGSASAFAIFGSLSLGLAVTAVLWFLGFISSWKRMAILVAATMTIHLVYVFAMEQRLLVEPLVRDLTVPLLGSVELLPVVTYFVVALFMLSTFLLVLMPGRNRAWALLLALICAGLATLAVAYVDSTQRGAWISFLTSSPLWLLWQTSLAMFIGIALMLAGVDGRGAPARTRLAALYVLLAYVVVFGTWSHFETARLMARSAEAQARADVETAARLAAAPSRDSLPPLEQLPVDRVLLMEGVGQWKPYISGANPLPAERQMSPTVAPSPERIYYYVHYSRQDVKPDEMLQMNAVVTLYPNEAWARYDVINQAMPGSLNPVTRFKNKIYQDGPYFRWPSGKMLILLDCQVLPEFADELLEAYLAKYPSAL